MRRRTERVGVIVNLNQRNVRTKTYMGRTYRPQSVVVRAVLMAGYFCLNPKSFVISLVLNMRPCIISTRIWVSKPQSLKCQPSSQGICFELSLYSYC
jgi:hypothetical protein